MKKQTAKAPGKQIDLEEMIQDVQSRTRSGKLKRPEQLKIRCTTQFKQFLAREAHSSGLSESEILHRALNCYMVTWSSEYFQAYTNHEKEIVRKNFQK